MELWNLDMIEQIISVAWKLILAFGISITLLKNIKINISFDLSQFLKERRERKILQLHNMCPHAIVQNVGGNLLMVEELTYSPGGNYDWVCKGCQKTFISNPISKEQQEAWKKDLNPLIKQVIAHKRYARKLGFIKKRSFTEWVRQDIIPLIRNRN